MRDIRIACPGVPAVYIFSLNALEAEIGTAVAFAALDDTARASLERISSKPRRIELLFGRFVTIQLLAQRLNIDAAEVRVRKGSFGKPELDRASYMSSVHFNISHSRDMLAVALC